MHFLEALGLADAIDEAGLPDDCVLHGLRKAAARTLADAGCSEAVIMAIIGHVTSRMVTHYTKSADRTNRARAAILKVERAGRRRNDKRPSD
jgi:hypothetical protein